MTTNKSTIPHPKATTTSDADRAADPRGWVVETPSGTHVKVLADDWYIEKGGTLIFIDQPFGEMDGTRELVAAFSASGWTRLFPPSNPRTQDYYAGKNTISRHCVSEGAHA